MRQLLVFTFSISICIQLYGQSTNVSTLFVKNEKKADLLFSKKAYRNALSIYLHINDKSASKNVHQKIAECYLNLHDPSSAESWYEELYKDPNVSDDIKLEYAQTLSMNNKHLEALEILNSMDRSKIDSVLLDRQVDFINSIKLFYHDSAAVVLREAFELNSSHSEFGTSYFKNHIVFASTRDHDLFIKRRSLSSDFPDEALTHLFSSRHVGDSYGPVSLYKKDHAATFFHDGPVTFYDGYRKAALTRSNVVNRKSVADEQGDVNLKLFLVEVANSGDFTTIKPFQYNSHESSVGHATFSQDGKRMYFSANYPKGHGGSDIYYSDLLGSEWTQPVNAGKGINTSGDELYPFLQNDSTLFFSSNGHGGFGGLDIFSVRRVQGHFKRAKNLGNPINSPRDDFSFMTDSTRRNGFLSSNRLGGKGSDDIYSFQTRRFFIQGETRDLNNPDEIIPNALIIVRDDEGIFVDSARSDEKGRYHLDLPYDEDFAITATKDGYSVVDDIGFSTRDASLGIDSLLIPLWKQNLVAKGRIFDSKTQKLLPGVTVTLTDLTESTTETGKADPGINKDGSKKSTTDTLVVNENGEYRFLVKPNRKYRIQASKEGFIPDGFDLNTQNIFKGELLNDIVLEEIYVEKSITLFDYNKYEIKQEWNKVLNDILRTLKKYPDYTLHIAAHADSRGTDQRNQLLSERRADAGLKFFTSNGIDRKRIVTVGFGEKMLLNNCSDGVKCPEEDHSKNRRAELKVQKR
jgi:outer membrane protein OmpA-like peptidoglycan-associated protein